MTCYSVKILQTLLRNEIHKNVCCTEGSQEHSGLNKSWIIHPKSEGISLPGGWSQKQSGSALEKYHFSIYSPQKQRWFIVIIYNLVLIQKDAKIQILLCDCTQ